MRIESSGDAGEDDYPGHGVAVPGLRRGLEGRQAADIVALKVHGHVFDVEKCR
jgi:hypothetical protein